MEKVVFEQLWPTLWCRTKLKCDNWSFCGPFALHYRLVNWMACCFIMTTQTTGEILLCLLSRRTTQLGRKLHQNFALQIMNLIMVCCALFVFQNSWTLYKRLVFLLTHMYRVFRMYTPKWGTGFIAIRPVGGKWESTWPALQKRVIERWETPRFSSSLGLFTRNLLFYLLTLILT